MRMRSVDVLLDFQARLLISVGGDLAQCMDAAMDVGVDLLVIVRDGVDDCARLLRSSTIVEIDKRLAVHLSGKYWEIVADVMYVKAHLVVFSPDCSGILLQNEMAQKIQRKAGIAP